MGDWLPGAVEGLRRLSELGTVVIHSCRVAPVEFHEPGREVVWRDELSTGAEIANIRMMLLRAGLGPGLIEVWTRPYKPPALVYIDDRGFRFEGDWPDVVAFVEEELEKTTSVGIGGNE